MSNVSTATIDTTFFNDLKGKKRDDAAKAYRAILIEQWGTGISVDWQGINKKIIAHWSVSALEYIKKGAWIQKSQNGRTYVIGKNRALKYDVFMVKVDTAYEIYSIGYSTWHDARDVLSKYKETSEIQQSDFIK